MRRFILAAWAASLGVFAFADSASALSISLRPSANVSAVYDTNPIGSPHESEESAFYLRGIPSFQLIVATSEGNSISATISAEGRLYPEHPEQNSYQENKYFTLDASEPVRLTSRLSMKPSIRFVNSNDYFRRNEIVQVPVESGFRQVETAVVGSSGARDYIGRVMFDYALTPITDLSVGGGYSERRYSNNGSGFLDYVVTSGSLGIARKTSDTVSVGVRTGGESTRYVGGSDSEAYSFEATFSDRFTPNVSLYARGGASLVDEPFDNTSGGERRRRWAPSGSLAIVFSEAPASARIETVYDLSSGGSFGLATSRWTIFTDLQWAISELWSAGGRISFQRSRAVWDTGSQNVAIWGTSVITNYALRPWASVYLQGTQDYQDFRTGTQSDFQRSTVSIGITLTNLLPLL